MLICLWSIYSGNCFLSVKKSGNQLLSLKYSDYCVVLSWKTTPVYEVFWFYIFCSHEEFKNKRTEFVFNMWCITGTDTNLRYLQACVWKCFRMIWFGGRHGTPLGCSPTAQVQYDLDLLSHKLYANGQKRGPTIHPGFQSRTSTPGQHPSCTHTCDLNSYMINK